MPKESQGPDLSSVSLTPWEPPATDVLDPRSTGDQAASGNAALSRIAADGTDVVPTYAQVLAQMLGPIAASITAADVPAEVAAVAQDVVRLAATQAASGTSAPTGDKGSGRGGGTGGGDDAKATSVASEIDTFIADKIISIIAPSSKGQALMQKFAGFEKDHPGVLLKALVLGSAVAMGRDFNIPTLSHTFKLDDHWALKAGVNAGSIRHIMLKSIETSITYSSGGFAATGGFTRDFSTRTNAFSLQLTDKDIDFLGLRIDSALASYKHSSPEGKPPTDTLKLQLKTAIDGFGLTLGGQDTISPTKGSKTGARHMNEQLSEEVALPPISGFKVSFDAKENFGLAHTQNTVGGKLTLPSWNDATVSIGEELPMGAGTGKPVTTISVLYKGITFTLSHGTAKGDSSGGSDAFGSVAPTTSSPGGWTVGIKIPFG